MTTTDTAKLMHRFMEWEASHTAEEWSQLPINGDNLDEAVNETINIVLSIPGVAGAVLAQAYQEGFEPEEPAETLHEFAFYYIWEKVTAGDDDK